MLWPSQRNGYISFMNYFWKISSAMYYCSLLHVLDIPLIFIEWEYFTGCRSLVGKSYQAITGPADGVSDTNLRRRHLKCSGFKKPLMTCLMKYFLLKMKTLATTQVKKMNQIN
jgi:hypothetical protein